MTVDLFVCVTCMAGQEQAGLQLYGALRERLQGEARIKPHAVQCLAVCKRPCTVAVASVGKWGYIIGDLTVADTDSLLDYAALYAVSESGAPPLKERPAAIRKGTIARVPPVLIPA